MSSAISRESSQKRQEERKPAWGWRVAGLMLGIALTLVGTGAVLINGIQGVQATGLVGTRGTFTVSYCTDTNPSGKNSDYECGGDFVPRGGDDNDGWSGTLENASDYSAGEKLDAAESWVGSEQNFRETGVGATLESLLWFCIGLVTLAMGASQSRKWTKSLKK
ncbi:hypothetical protein [Streptomyces sclerotialus]|uniref:hypothetical protein n=1 Tax=Streptomyces sclerotialus TaxID=1957 RepID=UPI0018C9F15F